MDAPSEPSPPASLGEVARVFLKLGFLAFGGPAAHTAMMEDELVRRRKWLSHKHFLDAVAAVQVVPGPNSTELAIHMGQLRRGFAGLLVAGACFIGPAVLIILPLAIAYVHLGRMSEATRAGLATVMHSVSAAVLGVILVAGLRLGRSAVKGPFGGLMLALGLIVALVLPGRFQPEIIVLAVAATAGIVADRVKAGAASMAVALPLAAEPGDWLRLAGFFLKVGGTLFGSGYVLVNYLESGLTAGGLGWLTTEQVFDAIAIGQTTPGPLLTTSTFAGYLIGSETFGLGLGGSIAAALVATGAMFLPSFVFVAVLGPILNRLRQKAWARAMLAAMGAAAVGLILAVCVRLAGPALAWEGRLDAINLVVAAATVALMLWRGWNATWFIAAALVLGLARIALL